MAGSQERAGIEAHRDQLSDRQTRRGAIRSLANTARTAIPGKRGQVNSRFMDTSQPPPMPRPQWYVVPRPVVEPALRLIVLPYAGGGAISYYKWLKELEPDVEMIAVQYPGRGALSSELPCKNLEDLVRKIETALYPLLDRPYVLFGHSMGATVGFELTRLMRTKQRRMPSLLAVSGKGAPQLASRFPEIGGLSDEAFTEVIRAFGGVPDEIIKEPEMMAFLLPVIRGDLLALEAWSHHQEPSLDVPILAIGGDSDPFVPPADVVAWAHQSLQPFRCDIFQGGHFFIAEWYKDVIHTMLRIAGIRGPAG